MIHRSPRRLEALAGLVPPASRVADVGTDRALLSRRLLATGRAAFCVATERNEARLARARGFPAGHPLRERLSLRSGDGLEPLRVPDRLDVVIVAGLGGPSIRRILDARRLERLGVRRLVLQPQTEPAAVRRWIAESGWEIVEERLALEAGRFYPVLAAERSPGRAPALAAGLSIEDLHEVGPCLAVSADPAVAEMWRRELARSETILAKAGDRPEGRGRREAMRRRDLARRILAALGEAATSGPVGRTPPSGCPPRSGRRSR